MPRKELSRGRGEKKNNLAKEGFVAQMRFWSLDPHKEVDTKLAYPAAHRGKKTPGKNWPLQDRHGWHITVWCWEQGLPAKECEVMGGAVQRVD